MGNRKDTQNRLTWMASEDGISQMSSVLLFMLVGAILLGVILPIFVSQVSGWSSVASLSGWSNLEAMQKLMYAIPLLFGVGMIIYIVRFFSRSRE